MGTFNCDACRDYRGKEVRDSMSHTYLWELCPYCNPKADDYPLERSDPRPRDYKDRQGRWRDADGGVIHD